MVSLAKPKFEFVQDYRPELRTNSTRNYVTTCYSAYNRYPKQTKYVKDMMARSAYPLKIFAIGVAQGQEPLTHINSAYTLAKKSNRPISDFIDLKTIDILKYPPELNIETPELDENVVKHLQNIYDSRSKKSIWGKPVEEEIIQMLQRGEKCDVILFNNVLQHMRTEENEKIHPAIQELPKLVSDNGIICFTVTDASGKKRAEMLEILHGNGFFEIEESSGIYKKISQ